METEDFYRKHSVNLMLKNTFCDYINIMKSIMELQEDENARSVRFLHVGSHKKVARTYAARMVSDPLDYINK